MNITYGTNKKNDRIAFDSTGTQRGIGWYEPYHTTSCVYYRDENLGTYDNSCKILSIPEAVYKAMPITLIADVLYVTIVNKNEKFWKIRSLSDEELITFVKKINSNLVGHKPITIIDFLTIANHYAINGSIEIIKSDEDE